MIVLWDLDDTLADWHARAQEGMQARPGLVHLVDRVQSTFDMFHGLSEGESLLMKEMLDEVGYYRHLAPKPGAIEAFKAAAEAGHENYIVTTPWQGAGHSSPTEKTLWVEEYLGPEWVGRLVLTHDKVLVRGDILIDDRDVVRGKIRSMRPTWTRIYVDMPWNQPKPDDSMESFMLRTFPGFENLPVLLYWVKHVRAIHWSPVVGTERWHPTACLQCKKFEEQARLAQIGVPQS